MTDVHAVAAATAKELGDGWKASPGAHCRAAFIRHKDGRGVFILQSHRTRGRLLIHGGYPPEWRGLPYGDHRPEITVSPDRPARGIAGDIKGRLLPRYEPLLDRARSEVASEIAQLARRDEVVESIRAAFPDSWTGTGHTWNSVSIHPRGLGLASAIEVAYDGETTLHLNHVSADWAVRLATAVQLAQGTSGRPGPEALDGRERPRTVTTALRRALRPALPRHS